MTRWLTKHKILANQFFFRYLINWLEHLLSKMPHILWFYMWGLILLCQFHCKLNIFGQFIPLTIM